MLLLLLLPLPLPAPLPLPLMLLSLFWSSVVAASISGEVWCRTAVASKLLSLTLAQVLQLALVLQLATGFSTVVR